MIPCGTVVGCIAFGRYSKPNGHNTNSTFLSRKNSIASQNQGYAILNKSNNTNR